MSAWIAGPVGLVAGCALLSAALVLALRPTLERYALARVTDRSMHAAPTAQGGGIAVVVSVVVACLLVLYFGPAGPLDARPVLAILAATVLLAAVGAIDDLRDLPVAPRLLAQFAAATAAIASLPVGARALPEPIPHAIELALLLVGVVWFVNLTNFMDGIDWMIVVEVVPVTAAVGCFWLAGWVGAEAGVPALALLGATVGFAPFNRHVARLFLGDVGSLPIGLLMAWLLLHVATASLAAALLAPLYFLADATVTLVRRLRSGERVWRAHRGHFYQLAAAGRLSVPRVTGIVFVLNLALAALATACLATDSAWIDLTCLAVGGGLTASVLIRFARAHA